MKYLNERIIKELGIDFQKLVLAIEDATQLLKNGEIAQPVKPYLRFNNPINRIIAMPAFVGGKFNSAGIKWIASYPDNIKHGIKRAHSVIILNDANTGVPTSVINTALVSGIRTSSVSGFILKKYFEVNNLTSLNCGIIGFGPIGQLHLEMVKQCLGKKIDKFYIYDINPIPEELINSFNSDNNIVVCDKWEDVYENAKLFITCTVSSKRYIDKKPKKGGIYLNVSLRDFQAEFLKEIDVNIVDSWEEICRENTDIEHAHLKFGLKKEHVFEITSILDNAKLLSLNNKSCMFNPMGMAIFDIAVAKYYLDLAIEKNNFVELED